MPRTAPYQPPTTLCATYVAAPLSCTLCRAAAAAEGELIRHKAAEEAAELAAKEAAWRAKAKEMNAATKASNDTLLAFKAAERQRDKQLEAAVEGGAGASHTVMEKLTHGLFNVVSSGMIDKPH